MAQRGCSEAQLKKAFHKASLGLHPDRLQGGPAGALTTERRAEAEELFKALSVAYDAHRNGEEQHLAA